MNIQKKSQATFTGAEIEEPLGRLDTLEWLDERLVKAVPENLEKVCLAPW